MHGKDPLRQIDEIPRGEMAATLFGDSKRNPTAIVRREGLKDRACHKLWTRSDAILAFLLSPYQTPSVTRQDV